MSWRNWVHHPSARLRGCFQLSWTLTNEFLLLVVWWNTISYRWSCYCFYPYNYYQNIWNVNNHSSLLNLDSLLQHSASSSTEDWKLLLYYLNMDRIWAYDFVFASVWYSFQPCWCYGNGWHYQQVMRSTLAVSVFCIPVFHVPLTFFVSCSLMYTMSTNKISII